MISVALIPVAVLLICQKYREKSDLGAGALDDVLGTTSPTKATLNLCDLI
jgi:hypothetical protein